MARMTSTREAQVAISKTFDGDAIELSTGEIINESGHIQETERNFGLLHLLSVGAVAGCIWPALGTSIFVAIYNGGPPGVIYEFLVAFVMYCFVAASLAELASAIPSSGGVYHWASVTAGAHGRIVGFFAGWYNLLAWLFGLMALLAVQANLVLGMWALGRDFEPQSWHVYIIYLILAWIQCLMVVYMNRALPYISTMGLFFIVAGSLITVVCLAVLPSRNGGYATHDFVWRDWNNQTGYSSNGFVFLLGMLNGAYSVGTPDVISHLAEEIPNPKVNMPRAMLGQYGVGLVTTLPYLVVLFYAISDFDQVLESKLPVPVVAIYQQGTGSVGGALGLTMLIFLPTVAGSICVYITAGRILWTLARDQATPFSGYLSRIHPGMKNPVRATYVIGVAATLLGLIYVGSSTAFQAFVGSFVVLGSVSYLLALVPHLASGRRHVAPGPFWMRGALGYVVGGVGCAYLAVFVVIFCFPTSMPVSAASMNYSCVILGGFSMLIGAWWACKRDGGYRGPQALLEYRQAQVVSLAHGQALR